MRQLIVITVLLTTLYSCAQEQKAAEEYPLHVGDIAFDPKLDDPDFKLCGGDDAQVHQYYNFGKGVQYKGEKAAIDEYFRGGLITKGTNEDTGIITIRFIVNCEGNTGRFRVQGMDNNFKEKKFSSELTNHILTLTKKMNGWIIGTDRGQVFNYYQYLSFKIEAGTLIEIMP
jgi:hypothetical protein